MESMDLDLDFETDEIKSFLKTKYQVIKSSNLMLEKSIQRRETEFANLVEELSHSEENVSLKYNCTKIYDNKYVIWWELRNNGVDKLKDIGLILFWNSSRPFNYEYKILKNDYGEDLYFCYKVKNDAKIAVIVDVPQFDESLEYKINGFVNYKRNNNLLTLKMETITIKSKDITNSNYFPQPFHIIEGNLIELLTLLVTSTKYKLNVKIPIMARSMENLLEIDCSLNKVQTNDVFFDGCSFFMAHKISPMFDGVVLDLRNSGGQSDRVCETSVYVRSESQLVSLVHHIYSNIKDVSIFSKELNHIFNKEINEDFLMNSQND